MLVAGTRPTVRGSGSDRRIQCQGRYCLCPRSSSGSMAEGRRHLHDGRSRYRRPAVRTGGGLAPARVAFFFAGLDVRGIGMKVGRKLLKRPMAACGNCGAVAGRLALTNERCGHAFKSGRICSGIFHDRTRPADWRECFGCSATGLAGSSRCAVCAGTGWRAVRSPTSASDTKSFRLTFSLLTPV